MPGTTGVLGNDRGTPVLRGARRGLAGGRLLLGGVMLVRPTWMTRPMGVDAAAARSMTWLVQMLGGREVALGLGALLAPANGGDTATGARAWSAAGALADGSDAFALASALRQRHVAPLPAAAVALTAAAAAAVGVRGAVGR